jgi:hypothetical protein
MTLYLWNRLGMGSDPRLVLKLNKMGGWNPDPADPTKGSNWEVDYNDEGPTIDWGKMGETPPPPPKDSPVSWSVWNVYDEEKHYYGTISLGSENKGPWKVTDYKNKNNDYLLDRDELKKNFTKVDGKDDHYQLECTKITRPGPPIISNQYWYSGQQNYVEGPARHAQFWVTDYGKDKWSPVTPLVNFPGELNGIQQSTAGPPWGSRAYPIWLWDPPEWKVSGGLGVAYEGLWQIAIQIGSDGRPEYVDPQGEKHGWCETFYLAERLPPLKPYPVPARVPLPWGPDYYSDGQGGGLWGDKEKKKAQLAAKKVEVYLSTKPDPNNPNKQIPDLDWNGVDGLGAYSREIDIMETMWQPDGPQINLGNMGGFTAWNTDAKTGNYGLKPKPLWSDVDVGGAPTKDFIIFGCLIRGDDLWLYAYKGPNVKNERNGQWYCTEKIPKKAAKDPRTNKDYKQKGPFVPYIGTWTNAEKPQGKFVTKYNHFIYLSEDNHQIKGKNPLKDPDCFGWLLNPRYP